MRRSRRRCPVAFLPSMVRIARGVAVAAGRYLSAIVVLTSRRARRAGCAPARRTSARTGRAGWEVGVKAGHVGLLRGRSGDRDRIRRSRAARGRSTWPSARMRCSRCGQQVAGRAGAAQGGEQQVAFAARRARGTAGSAAARSRFPTGRPTRPAATAGPAAGRPATGRSPVVGEPLAEVLLQLARAGPPASRGPRPGSGSPTG